MNVNQEPSFVSSPGRRAPSPHLAFHLIQPSRVSSSAPRVSSSAGARRDTGRPSRRPYRHNRPSTCGLLRRCNKTARGYSLDMLNVAVRPALQLPDPIAQHLDLVMQTVYFLPPLGMIALLAIVEPRCAGHTLGLRSVRRCERSLKGASKPASSLTILMR